MSDKIFDQSVNILKKRDDQLDKIFNPKNVALIGATEKENSVGKTLLENLTKSKKFKGKIYPINPKRETVLGIKAYKSIDHVPEEVDLAVIATPAKTVPGLIAECAKANVSTAIIISAGFKELGEPGIKLEKEIEEIAKKAKMRIVGPNCLGVMNPINGLNATFAADMALEGNVAFISQSGALCTAVLDWSLKEKVGFSSFVSVGSMMDVKWNDLINYFGNDPNTKSILIYMESVGNPREFLSAAREVALTKPIILIKAGKTEESAKAAVSHTGSLAGSNDVLNAALKRVGVLRVDTISELFNMAEILSKQPLPKGPNLSIITNAGGPGVIATDALIENGAKLAPLSQQIIQELNEFLPPEWSHNNPIDIIGDASPDRYFKTIESISKDEQSDGVLVILTPQNMTDPTAVANELKKFSNLDKPIFASWMGGLSVKEGWDILTDANIPMFHYPDNACKAFSFMYKYHNNLTSIYETPVLPSNTVEGESTQEKCNKINAILQKAYKEKKSVLDEYESKKVLELFDIPVVKTEIATSEEQAVKYAEEMGYPVVLKIYSKAITHKKDVGGVKLNLNNKEAVQKAYKDIYEAVKKIGKEKFFEGVTVQPMIKLEGYEIILGSSTDPLFGPVLLFGTGGSLVEVYKDTALGLPPLNSTLAKRVMEQTKIYHALKGVRGEKPADLKLLNSIFVRFSNLAAHFPMIKEIDINPLLVSHENIIALDARIVLFEEGEDRPEIAFRPYPTEYVANEKLKDDTKVDIRPIRPEDEPLLITFLKELSEKTILNRYLKAYDYDALTAKERLIQLCFVDYDREIALVATHQNEILGVCRLTKLLGSNEGEISLVVKDKWQYRGVGTKLLSQIIMVAKSEKLDLIKAEISLSNLEMQNLVTKAGFKFDKENDMALATYNF